MSDIRVAVDLREHLGPVRDQGARPTCLAFAASDTHVEARRDRVALSCEYAFYHAQRRAGRSLTQGAVLSSTLETLREDGQPLERDWPYRAVLPEDLVSGAPPETIEPLFARDGMPISPRVDDVVRVLDGGQAVIVLLTLSSSFFRPDERGVIEPDASERPDSALRHAVAAVGHGSLDGHRVVLVRNSWGMGWGRDGHGWITESFLAPRLFAAAKLTGEVNVPARTAPA